MWFYAALLNIIKSLLKLINAFRKQFQGILFERKLGALWSSDVLTLHVQGIRNFGKVKVLKGIDRQSLSKLLSFLLQAWVNFDVLNNLFSFERQLYGKYCLSRARLIETKSRFFIFQFISKLCMECTSRKIYDHQVNQKMFIVVKYRLNGWAIPPTIQKIKRTTLNYDRRY